MCQKDLPRRKTRFSQFTLWQFLVLFIAISLLLGILAPRIRKAYNDRQSQVEFRRKQEIQANLDAAVRAGDASLVRHALEAGADPNGAFPGIRHSFGTAIRDGHVEIVKLLLDSGAHFEECSDLAAAIDCDQPVDVRLAMIRILLQHGADPHRQCGGTNAMDLAVRNSDAAVGDLLREHAVEFGPREMAAFNRLDELRHVVEENPGVVRERFRPVYASRPGHGPTLLGIALGSGYREMALYLLDHDAPIDVTEGLGSTLLHRAARGGDPELIRLLVARGLDVNARDDYGDTPLTDSVRNTSPDAINTLIELGTDVNAQGINQETALHLAARCGRSEVVSRLLAGGADSTIKNVYAETALDVVQKQIQVLLEDDRSSVPRAGSQEKDHERRKKSFREIEQTLLKASP